MKESNVRRVPMAVCALLVLAAGCGGETASDDSSSVTTAAGAIAAVEPQIGASSYYQTDGIEYVYAYLGFDATAVYSEEAVTAGAERCVALAFEQNAEYSSAFVLERVTCWLFATYDDMALALPGFTEGGAIPKSPNGDCWMARSEGIVDVPPTITRNPASC